MFNARVPKLGQTWIEMNGETCGAQPDARGPIGGGEGYVNRVPTPDDTIATLDDLLDALGSAKSGDVVFVDGRAEIDCTQRVYIEELVIEIPEGVTLASDRGADGSGGGMILSDTFATSPLICAMGPGVRVTGLRIAGPNPKPCFEHHNRSFREGRGHEYYYKFPTSSGIMTEHPGLEVDNCELGGWSLAAVKLSSGTDHHVHHSFIHHNPYNGLGYGVSHHTSSSLIEYNLFNHNRHSIAGSGKPPSGYEARHNVEIRYSVSHCFDMHGGRDRKDGTTIAGSWMKVHHNTFRCPKVAVAIRGVPEDRAEIHHNWFYQKPGDLVVRSDGNTSVTKNAFGMKKPQLVDQVDI